MPVTGQAAMAVEQEARIRKYLGKAPRKKFRRPPKPLSMRPLEREHRVTMLKMTELARELVAQVLFPAMPSIEVLSAVRVQDSALVRTDAPSWVPRIKAIFGDIRNRWEDLHKKALGIDLAKTAGKVSRRQLESLRRQMRSVLKIDVFVGEPEINDFIEGWIEDNRQLAADIGNQVFREAEGIVLRGFRNGERAESLVAEVQKRLGVAESRAGLIAVDQVNKLAGSLNRSRQIRLGFKRFIWRNSRDQAVRPKHKDYRAGGVANRTYSWNEGHPTERYPGWPIRCRCHAEPVFDDLLE